MRITSCRGLSLVYFLLACIPAFTQTVPLTPGATIDNVGATKAEVLAGTPASLEEARTLFRKGDFEHAIPKYQELLQERKALPAAYAGLTRVYLRKNDIKESWETVSKGMKEAESPDLRVALGEVYFREGKFQRLGRNGMRSSEAGTRSHARISGWRDL
jgi:tetratricopeptide (TPR) repeat protein